MTGASHHPGFDSDNGTVRVSELLASVSGGGGRVLAVGTGYGTLYARAAGRDDFDVLQANEHGAYCWRGTMARQRLQQRVESAVERGHAVEIGDRSLWPTRLTAPAGR